MSSMRWDHQAFGARKGVTRLPAGPRGSRGDLENVLRGDRRPSASRATARCSLRVSNLSGRDILTDSSTGREATS